MRQLGGQTILFVMKSIGSTRPSRMHFSPCKSGLITLVGHDGKPVFEIIAPLLSRCRVLVLKPLSEESLVRLLGGPSNADQDSGR
jgi:putative ATPase